MNVPLKSLHCFLTLVEIGNYTRAAEKLYITQPALTKMIQRLEENLGQSLFIRNNQKVLLTETGHLLVNSAQVIVGQWHRLQEDISNLNGLKSGQLRLGLSPMTGGMFITLLSQFKSRYPGIEVKLAEVGGYAAERALLNDSLDLAFTALPTTNPNDFDVCEIANYPLQLCLPEEHPLTDKESVGWTNLRGYPFIQYNDDLSISKLIDQLSRKANVKLDVVAQSGQWEFIAAMVDANMGLAILPEPICQKVSSSKLKFINMNPAMTWDLALFWRKSLPLTPAAAAFLKLTEQYIANDYQTL